MFATVTGLGGPGSEIGAFPPIDTLIRNASDELMLTDSDSDSDEDLLHDGPMGGASDSSSMDSEDARWGGVAHVHLCAISFPRVIHQVPNMHASVRKDTEQAKLIIVIK